MEAVSKDINVSPHKVKKLGSKFKSTPCESKSFAPQVSILVAGYYFLTDGSSGHRHRPPETRIVGCSRRVCEKVLRYLNEMR